MTQRQNQPAHDSIVQALTTALPKHGYENVKADLPGHTKPLLIHWKGKQEGHIPDVTATKDGKGYIFEVETADTITIQHTVEQWKLFAASADLNNKEFVVVVPTGCGEVAREQVKQLKLTASVWEA
jgi:hypothetical protein